MSEDCLFLNVFTPVDASALPVLVWIHGGAFLSGSGGEYNGTELARQGLVVVTVNYRLAGLGFYASEALAHESPDFPSTGGANGLGDQIAALEWVRENIRAFGGDPEQVTLAGESSGSVSVSYLLHAPRARGLFRRAVAESGSCVLAAAGSGLPRSSEEALATSGAWERGLGCRDNAGALECLRSVDAAQLVSGAWYAIRPSIDGVLLPADPAVLPLALPASGVVDLVAGSTSLDSVCAPPWDDGSGTGSAHTAPWPTDCDGLRRRLAEIFGASVGAEVAAQYPCQLRQTEFEVGRRWLELSRDVSIACPMVWLMEKLLAASPASKVRVYEFAYNANQTWKGLAAHGAELGYVFNKQDVGFFPNQNWDGRLARQVSGYWGSFAASGTPQGQVDWPVYDTTGERYLRLDQDTTSRIGYGTQSRCSFWYSLVNRNGSATASTQAYRKLVNQCFT